MKGRRPGTPGDRGPRPRRSSAGPKRVRFSKSLQIVHEDAELLVVDKPAGLLTASPEGQDRECLFDLVKDHVRLGRGRSRRAWIVHRLDKEASGLLVFAKSQRAFEWLKEDLRQKRVHRLYHVVVEGEIATPEQGTIQSFIQDEEDAIPRSVKIGDLVGTTASRAGDSTSAGGVPKLAVTHWRMLARGHGRTLVQCRLETGRKNQIRVHMAEFGHPVVGDARFGAKSDPIGRVALHAAELGFTHPTTGQAVRLTSPTPGTFGMLVGRGGDVGPAPGGAVAQDQSPGRTAPAADTSWDEVASWYDDMIEEARSDHFREVIVPGTLRLVSPSAGMRLLDVACGQGSLARVLDAQGVNVLGVDAAPQLINAAKRRVAPGKPWPKYVTGDARDLLSAVRAAGEAPGFDAATCVMALMNIDPLEPVLRGIADTLRPGGVLVVVLLHPAFRAPGQTRWAWDEAPGSTADRSRRPRGGDDRPEGEAVRQYRRVDGYLSAGQSPITMNPGGVAQGAKPVTTWTFHRPIQTYVRSIVEAGLLISALEEWPSVRASQPGKSAYGRARAAEENRARREIPMFLAIRAIRTPRG